MTPVVPTGGRYGENPKQSQFPASGALYIPKATVNGAPEELPQPEIRKLIEGSPHLGYTWDITNVSLPVAIELFPNKSVEESTVDAEVELSLYSANQPLFSFVEKVQFPTHSDGTALNTNLFFNTSPPIPVAISGGQQIEYRLKLYSPTVSNKELSFVNQSLMSAVALILNKDGSVKERQTRPGSVLYQYI